MWDTINSYLPTAMWLIVFGISACAMLTGRNDQMPRSTRALVLIACILVGCLLAVWMHHRILIDGPLADPTDANFRG
jgi:hypothetical protein